MAEWHKVVGPGEASASGAASGRNGHGFNARSPRQERPLAGFHRWRDDPMANRNPPPMGFLRGCRVCSNEPPVARSTRRPERKKEPARTLVCNKPRGRRALGEQERAATLSCERSPIARAVQALA
jgi:hypothetical protein